MWTKIVIIFLQSPWVAQILAVSAWCMSNHLCSKIHHHCFSCCQRGPGCTNQVPWHPFYKPRSSPSEAEFDLSNKWTWNFLQLCRIIIFGHGMFFSGFLNFNLNVGVKTTYTYQQRSFQSQQCGIFQKSSAVAGNDQVDIGQTIRSLPTCCCHLVF